MKQTKTNAYKAGLQFAFSPSQMCFCVTAEWLQLQSSAQVEWQKKSTEAPSAELNLSVCTEPVVAKNFRISQPFSLDVSK